MLSKRQKEILDYIAQGPKQIEPWMHTNSIAALSKRRLLELAAQKRSLKLKITEAGNMMRTIRELDYKVTLRRTAQTRRRYRRG